MEAVGLQTLPPTWEVEKTENFASGTVREHHLACGKKHVGRLKLDEILTPPKTNMEPENEPLEEEIPMKNHHS